MADLVRVQRAIVSVFDKTGLEALAAALKKHGVELISTGMCARMAGITSTVMMIPGNTSRAP